MKRLLRAFLSSLKKKYRAEQEIHQDIEEKITRRVSPMFQSAEDFLQIEEIVLQHVEDTYLRMLTTKRHLYHSRSMIDRFIRITRRNLENLYQIASLELASSKSENISSPAVPKLLRNRTLQGNRLILKAPWMELGFGRN